MKYLPILILSIAALAVGLLAGNYFFKSPQPSTSSGRYVEPPGGDFTLQSSTGAISLSDYKGKVLLLYFGYTSCPDVCPTSLSRIGNAFKKLTPEELKQVQGIFISVDPDRDTPKKLADYSKFFHPQIVGVTGTKDQIDEVTKRYDVQYRKAAGSTAAGYLVDHTSFIFLLDKQGKIREYLPHAIAVEDALTEIRSLIKGKPE